MKGKQTFLSFVHNVVEVSVSMVPSGEGGSSRRGSRTRKYFFSAQRGSVCLKMGDRVPRALTLDPQLNTGEGGPGREYRARRERPLDIDVTSVVNEKDTRGYIIRANKTERRPRCQKIAGESLLIRQCWLGDSS